jgi:hypothetical protein|tara:strand:+ start:361 stop:834 length:474 start_codon:yes stop_codon:yes gene_type:complete
MKIFKNKRGLEAADYFSFLFYAIGVFVLIFVINIFLPKVPELAEFKIEDLGEQSSEDHFFISYLRAPVANGDMADLIIVSYLNKDYKKFEEETSNLFRNLYEKETGWEFLIDDEEIINRCEAGTASCSGIFSTFDFILPMPKNKDTNSIKIQLKLYK